jgi:hypothetical protein
MWWGIPLVVILALPWFVWANWITEGEFFRVFIWYHNIERGLGGAQLRSNPWWFYFPQFLGDFLPWSPLVLVAGVMCRRWAIWGTDSEARFGLVWFLSVLFTLSCARFKRADYLLPAFPGAALFLGCCLDRWLDAVRDPASLRRRVMLIGGVLAAVLAAWTFRLHWTLPAQEAYRNYQRFAREIRQLVRAREPVLFFRTEAHALAFHLGRPLEVLIEWADLQERMSHPGMQYLVMSPATIAQYRQELGAMKVEEVMRNTDLSGGDHERPLVLLRTHPETAR